MNLFSMWPSAGVLQTLFSESAIRTIVTGTFVSSVTNDDMLITRKALTKFRSK